MSSARTAMTPTHQGLRLLPYVVALFAAFAYRLAPLTFAFLGASALYALWSMRRVRGATPREVTLLAIVLVGPSLLLAVNIVRVGFSIPYHFLVAVCAALTAFGATRNPEVYLFASRWLLAGIQAWVVAFIGAVGVKGFPLENLIPNSSSNGITSYLLVLQINYCMASFALHRRFAWFTQLVTLFICVVGFGRGSILTSVALLGVSALVAAVDRRAKGRVVLILALIIAAVAGVRSANEIGTFVGLYTKIGQGLVSQPRVEMLRAYFGKMTVVTAVTGVGYENTPIANDWNGNPHNSFVRAHHLLGAGYVAMIVLLPLWAMRYSPGWASRGYIGLLMGLLYFRAFSEPIVFPTFLDFFAFGMCFVILAPRTASGAAQAASATPPLQGAT